MNKELVSNEQKKKYNAFWNRDYDERAALFLSVPAPADTPIIFDLPAVKAPEDIIGRWENTEFRAYEYKQRVHKTLFMAEGIPTVWPNFGPGVLAAMLGSDYTYYPNTVWFGKEPLIQDWSDLDKMNLLPENPMNKLVLDLTRKFCEGSNGHYMVGMTDMGGNLDIVASLRGTERLLYDMVDEPEKVDKAVRIVDDFWEIAFNESYSILKNANNCMSTWIPLWSPKRWYTLQSDFSAMISPDQFERFVVPSITRMSKFLDNSIYHLDGEGELPHVDHLLSVDRLDGIQWTPGAGKPGLANDKWFPLYEKIQAKGICLVLMGINTINELTKVLSNLSHKGLLITSSLKSVEEAEEVIQLAKKLAK